MTALKTYALPVPGLSLYLPPAPPLAMVYRSSYHSHSSKTMNKQRKLRQCWSPELHQRFVNGVDKLSGAQGMKGNSDRDGEAKRSNDQGEKNNWMRSATLWNYPVTYGNSNSIPKSVSIALAEISAIGDPSHKLLKLYLLLQALEKEAKKIYVIRLEVPYAGPFQ
nr:myb family transcription factor EFM-like [Ipomoea batatas]